MLGDKWEVPWMVENYLVNYQTKVRGYTLKELLDKTTFKKVDWFWMSGVTLHPDCVILDDSVTDNDNEEFIACVCAHEMVHVAQQLDWGHIMFMLKYGIQALGCFFSYECLKGKSIEKEAYEFEHAFGESIGYFKREIPGAPDAVSFNMERKMKVAQAVDFELKQKYIRRGGFKPTGKTAWAKRRNS